MSSQLPTRDQKDTGSLLRLGMRFLVHIKYTKNGASAQKKLRNPYVRDHIKPETRIRCPSCVKTNAKHTDIVNYNK